MGRFLRQYDKEYMKMAMLKQEETFREQVNELHRLYRVQKLLMRDVTRAAETHAGRQTTRERRRRPAAAALFDLELPAAGDDEEDAAAAADVELTLATGGSGWRSGIRKKADSSESGSGASFSSSASTESRSGGSGASGSGSAGESLDVRDWGLWCRTPMEEGQVPVAVAVRQGMAADQRPSWQMPYLSLNMT